MSPIEIIRSNQSLLRYSAAELADPAVDAFLSTRAIVRDALRTLGPFEGSNGLILYTLENLLSRIEEQTEGGLVCFATGCPAAAETIARTVVETSVLGGVSARRMFGGAGLCRAGKMFGLVAYDVAYLKVNESNREDFLRAGSSPFQPYPDKGKKAVMPYYEVPPDVLENRDELVKSTRRSAGS